MAIAGFQRVKVFSATRGDDRNKIGERVTAWLRDNTDNVVVERLVLQSSDRTFHCFTICLFLRERT